MNLQNNGGQKGRHLPGPLRGAGGAGGAVRGRGRGAEAAGAPGLSGLRGGGGT